MTLHFQVRLEVRDGLDPLLTAIELASIIRDAGFKVAAWDYSTTGKLDGERYTKDE